MDYPLFSSYSDKIYKLIKLIAHVLVHITRFARDRTTLLLGAHVASA